MVVGFARLEGRPVGVVANQSKHLGGVIDVNASQKGARFIRTCDAFGVPLLVLVDTPGFMPGARQESAGIIRHGADLLRAFAAARCARVTVVLRKAFGGAFITMNSKDLGADAAFAWPTAEIGIMGPRAAVEILHRRQLLQAPEPHEEAAELARRYAEAHLSAGTAAALGVIDAVIDPAETRHRVTSAFRDRERAWDRRPRRLERDTRPEAKDPARQGCAIWFTGPPCSGKSTVAAVVERRLRARGEKVEVLDGDAVRESLSKDLGFSRRDRDANVRRIAFIADVLSRNGVLVLAAAISPYRETRDEVRALLGRRFLEVHVKASLEERVRRDRRGLYARALGGELPGFTSVSDPYEEPLAPELVLDTERETPEQSAARVLALLEERSGSELAA
jgi:adenylyl-sulfate kinase